MFIAKNNDKIIIAKNTREELVEALRYAVYTDIIETEIPYQFYDGKYLTPDEVETEEQKKTSKLSVTKSDFFDATIKAFGLDANDLLPIVSKFISKIEVSDTLKKIALNNYQNAKDFYRNHEIFNVLAGNPIVINDQLTITITSEQFDNYFKKANQHDPEAYKELLPITGE